MSVQPIDPQLDQSLRVESLGRCTILSPLPYKRFMSDADLVMYDLDPARLKAQVKEGIEPLAFERAGARERIYFDPANVKVAIVTCGGLCPGLNDVIRAMVHELYFMYGVRRIKGVQYGWAGLNPSNRLELVDLNPGVVQGVNEDGGSFLGSSRGPQPVDVMVDTLLREDIRILFAIGGDGTLRGAMAINNEIKRRGLSISVVGVPKTIDNDIAMVSRTFGFDSAVAQAVESLRCAQVEARGARNGIGIVKLMGRHSGFVAANAALAVANASFVLVPEIPFELEGPRGFLASLEKVIATRGHALIVVAEGAGQELFNDELGTDPSGNRKLADIGLLLKTRILEYFQSKKMEHTVKYIDPSYIIRSVPAAPNDRIFCVFLGQHAVHAAMAGKTGVLIGSWNNLFVHVPIKVAIRKRKQIHPDGILWSSVLESTGQPESMINNH